VSLQRVCAVADVPEPGVLAVTVDGVPVAVVRDEHGGLHAILDVCSHQDVALSEGEVEDCQIECWLHGSSFDLRTGEPTSLPAVRPVPVYHLSVQGDDVLVDVHATTATSSLSNKES
jgi:3-phenylpropionate/trans-cinnamate dioxygenase ferredoxin subunit